MTIQEAAKKTGLTKKAIRYYEDKNLISPEVSRNSGYKNYSPNDIDQLSQIAFLRSMEMPVSSIRSYLKGDGDDRKALLESHMEKIKRDIEALENISSALERELANNPDCIVPNGRFSKPPEYSKTFPLHRISELFPTPLGKYITIHFGPYLGEPADTPEKKEALYNIISFLDDMPEEDIEDDLSEYFEEIGDYKLTEIFKEINENIASAANDGKITCEEIEKYIQTRNELYKDDRLSQIARRIRTHLDSCGFYHNFIGNLKILSAEYSEFSAKIVRLNSSLRLEYDKDGMIVRK